MGGQETALFREPAGIKQNSEKVRIFPKTTTILGQRGLSLPTVEGSLLSSSRTNQQVKINPHKTKISICILCLSFNMLAVKVSPHGMPNRARKNL